MNHETHNQGTVKMCGQVPGEGWGGGGTYQSNLFIYHFGRNGSPFIYLLLRKGTPLTYLVYNTATPFLALVIKFSSITRRNVQHTTSVIYSVHVVKQPIFLPFYIPQIVKSLPFNIPEAWKRYPFWAEPPGIGHYTEYTPLGQVHVCLQY